MTWKAGRTERSGCGTKNKREYSKVLTAIVVGVILTVAVGFIVFVCYEMHRLGDLSPVTYIGPSIVGLLASVIGFYMWRAKAKSQTDLEWEQTKRLTQLKAESPAGIVRGEVNVNDSSDTIIV